MSMKELAEALPQGDKGQGRGGQGRARGRGWGRGRRGGGGPLPSDEAAKIGGRERDGVGTDRERGNKAGQVQQNMTSHECERKAGRGCWFF